MLQSLRTQAYAVLFIIPEKPKLILFTPALLFVTLLIIYHPLSLVLQSLRTQAYAVLLNTPGKPTLSLFTEDGKFCTPV